MAQAVNLDTSDFGRSHRLRHVERRGRGADFLLLTMAEAAPDSDCLAGIYSADRRAFFFASCRPVPRTFFPRFFISLIPLRPILDLVSARPMRTNL